MSSLRKITPAEIEELRRLGNTAEEWDRVAVSSDFEPSQIVQSRLEGRVEIGSGARIVRSRVRNCRLGERVLVESVTALECRRRAMFGNGVRVAVMNECGGRSVKICDALSAQVAYVMAVYRHRPQTLARLEAMIDALAEARASELCEVGAGSRLTGVRLIREVRIGCDVVVDGASCLENGTVCDGARIGVDVKARDFIVAEDALLDNGVTLERCFVGECCIMDKGFTAAESLFFANSHCENGEAAAIFAGPYTVSHHKSTLLIAGMFSFFNAGSGSNQSNHLFKSGAVHQAVHQRGCKFASGAYIMAPALEGPFTMVMGRHTSHHDTSDLPYSYLIEREGRSMLMPGANLTSYGTVRDLEKWPRRDRRRRRRDVIDFDADNPFVAERMVRALEALRSLEAEDPDAESYTYNKVQIRSTALARGLKLYNRAVAAAQGAMLEKGGAYRGGSCRCDGTGPWIDVAGQYMTRRACEEILAEVDEGRLVSLDGVDDRFRAFDADYPAYAFDWAFRACASRLGHAPSPQELARAVDAGLAAREELRRTTDADRDRDCSMAMAVGYGLDGDEHVRRADYLAVRGLE